MCFSMEASFGSAVVVGGVAIATLPQIRTRGEVLLGTLPLMFSIHQWLEGFNWLALEGRIASGIGDWSILLYEVFAYALLPAIVPWSLWLAEPLAKNRHRLFPLVILGSGLCVIVLWELTKVPVSATIRGYGIVYESRLGDTWWFPVLYVISTCIPSFLSSYPWMQLFGALIVATFIATELFETMFLTSVWRLAASLVSILIYLHFRRVRRLATN